MTRVPAAAAALALLVGCSRSSAPSSGAVAGVAASTRAPASSGPLSSLAWDDSPIDWSREVPVTPQGGQAQAGYVGSDACKPCHADIARSYARHSMARTGPRPLASLDAGWLARIFDAGAAETIVHERSGFSYRPFRRGGEYFVEEFVAAQDGGRVQHWVQPVTYAYSAGSYGMAFYFKQGSRLYQVPLDYYAQAKRWGLDPAAVDGNPRFSKPLRSFCVSCHADYPRRRAGTDDVFFDPLPTGVGCERCHGPGQEHVRSMRPEDIVNPARLAPARRLDVCVQCHESNHSSLRADRDEFSYRPGQPVSEFRVNFVGDPQQPDQLILLAHPERMVRSACWRGSGGALTCTSCHDPHRSSFDQPAAYWDRKCDACHHEKPCTEAPAIRHERGDHCVACHMRSGPPESPTLVSITDHWIQRRPPPVRPGKESPAHFTPWPDLVGAPAPGDDLEALEAMARTRLGEREAGERMAAQVASPALHLPLFYTWLGERYQEDKQPRDAIRAYAAVLRFAPDSQDALYAYADGMLGRGSPDARVEATHALDRLLALDPQDPDALEMKAKFLFLSGHTGDAQRLFTQATGAGPWTAASQVGLATVALREGRLGDAIAELEAARRIEPGDAWVLDKLADAYARNGDAARAAEVAHASAYYAERGQRALTAATRWLPQSWR